MRISTNVQRTATAPETNPLTMPRVSPLATAKLLAAAAALVASAACSARMAHDSAADAGGERSSLDGASSAAHDAGTPWLDLDGASSEHDGSASGLDDDSGVGTTDLDASFLEPDAFPPSCGIAPVADATPGTCEASPADLACDAASDCKVVFVGHCGCFLDAYGVNVASDVSCPMPPCAPPPPGSGGCTSSGYDTEDCHSVSSLADIGVACVGHVCRTFSTSAQ